MATGSNVTFTAATGITLQAGFTVEAGAEFLAEIAQPAGPPTGLPRDYVGGIEYYNGVMEAIYHAEGRVSFDNGQSLYEYNLTDHLGNLRLSFADRNGDGDVDITSDPGTNEVLQEHHYYPFGMALEGDWVDNPVKGNRYRYNGKELEEDFGLNWYAYGARYYDPAIGRFTGVDPISDEFPHVSTYNYAENEPVGSIDLWGLQRYKVTNGVLIGNGVTNSISEVTRRPRMNTIQGVVLHRTVSSTAESAVRTTRSNGGRTGFHIVVDKDGTITQVNNFENRANHVGKPKGDSGLDNYNSIGIEVVGLYLGENVDGNAQWESLTEEQIQSTSEALATILVEYGLEIGDVFPHEDVSRKTEGEGGTVLSAIFGSLYQHYTEQNSTQQNSDQQNGTTWQNFLQFLQNYRSE